MFTSHRNWIGGFAYIVECVFCMHEAPINARILQSFFLFQDCTTWVKQLVTRRRNWIGGLSHMVERVLCMHEAPGSMPGSSSFFFFFKIVLVGLRSCSQVIVTGSVD